MITTEQVREHLTEIAKKLIFDHNTEELRNQAADAMDELFLEHHVPFEDYYIQCNELNNTPEDIENNRFTISVFRNVEGKWIETKMELVRTGVEFEDDEA